MNSPVYVAGLERGVRPIGLWSMSMTLSIRSRPSIRVCVAGHHLGAIEVARQRLVEDVGHQRGLARSRHARHRGEHAEREFDREVRRLLARAPHHAQPLLARRAHAAPPGTGTRSSPRRYRPVSEVGCSRMSPTRALGHDLARRTRPARGPRSITWSAARIVSSSCSTTMTVLPRSRRPRSVPSSRSLSRWCRPMLGSSRM